MFFSLHHCGLFSAGAALVAAVPGHVSNVHSRASSCTFTDAASAMATKTACSTITLNNIAVPAGKTLDLTKLNSGTQVYLPMVWQKKASIHTDMTQVVFEGTTTFEYSEWEGPLISVSGSSITVTGATGSILDGGGARWWDGKGSNGGKKKPKFFYAHSMKSSSITGITIKDSPVQVFSINGAEDLTLKDITVDDSAGDTGTLGHNTDAFDISESSGVTIIGASVKNQDDCLAINSGTVGISYASIEYSQTICLICKPATTHRLMRLGYHFHQRHLLRWPRPLHRLSRRSLRQHSLQCPHRGLFSHQLRQRHVPSSPFPVFPTSPLRSVRKRPHTHSDVLTNSRDPHQNHLRRHRHRH